VAARIVINHMPHPSVRFRRALVPGLLWASSAAWSQGAPGAALVHAEEPLPARYTLCQRELAGQPGERQRLLRACLARRLEAERVAERNCRREVAGVKGAAARHQAQQGCLRQALAVPSAELPRAPAPRPQPLPTAAPPASPAPAAPAQRRPAAGEN
jgi:hypothetical protein